MLPANAASVVDSAEARQLPVLIAEWEVADDERSWLARALRVDLALLTELPQLALVCLARRCMHDAAWFVRAPDVAAEWARAAELAASWATGPRLRAVRPPAVPLAGGVREEYRTSARGELCVSGDGSQLGIVGDDATISWDRASGRRTDRGASAAFSGTWSPLLPASLGATWALAKDNTWARLGLRSSDGVEVVVDLGVDMICRAVRPLDDDRVIIDVDDMDSDPRHCLVDLRDGGRIVWTSDGDCRAAVLDGAYVISAGTRGVAIDDAATGARITSWRAPMVDAIAVLRDRSIVTRSGDVIRVWDRDARGAELAGTDGWTTAQFSPDGARLVTGGNLSNARTGAHIADMPVDGPGWLEGGPPLPCQALVDGAFVEIQPMGLRVWDARDGHLRFDDHDRSAHALDKVAFDPRGRYYAIGHSRTAKLAIRRLDGALLFQRTVPLATRDSLGFTADGEHVWWRANDGTRWIHALVPDTNARLLGDDEHVASVPPAKLAVRDGLLVIGELAAPCDEPEVVVSPDGRAFAARRSHYVIED